MKRINRHSLPFLLLFLIHTSLLVYSLYKKKDKKALLILLLSNIGLAYLFEYVILNLFKAYRYKPKVLKRDYFDNIFGAVLSQGVIVPFTSIFLTAFQVKWKIRGLFVLYFVLVERLFIKIGVYKNYWWKTIYTAILMPCYFLISDVWYKHLQKGTGVILHLSLYLAVWVTRINILYIFAILRQFRFGFGRYHSNKEHFILAPLYSIMLSGFTVWMIQKEKWLSKASILLFATGLDVLLKKAKLVNLKGIMILENQLIHIGMIVVAAGFKKMIFHDRKN